jgi:hypothetical protein
MNPHPLISALKLQVNPKSAFAAMVIPCVHCLKHGHDKYDCPSFHYAVKICARNPFTAEHIGAVQNALNAKINQAAGPILIKTGTTTFASSSRSRVMYLKCPDEAARKELVSLIPSLLNKDQLVGAIAINKPDVNACIVCGVVHPRGETCPVAPALPAELIAPVRTFNAIPRPRARPAHSSGPPKPRGHASVAAPSQPRGQGRSVTQHESKTPRSHFPVSLGTFAALADDSEDTEDTKAIDSESKSDTEVEPLTSPPDEWPVLGASAKVAAPIKKSSSSSGSASAKPAVAPTAKPAPSAPAAKPPIAHVAQSELEMTDDDEEVPASQPTLSQTDVFSPTS